MPETGDFHSLFEALTPDQQVACFPSLLEVAGVGVGNEARLKKWWRENVDWGVPGDFDKCVTMATRIFGEHGVDIEPKAWCAALHKEFTGATPGHAAGETHESAGGNVPDTIRETLHEQTTLAEAAVEGSARAGRMTIQIITPGKGSSGNYSAAVCEAAAPLIKAGTPMYLDHPTEDDAMARPERSLRDLAAVFTEAARWDPARNAVVAQAQVFTPYREVLTEMAPFIGVSVRGDGVIDRRTGVVESIDSIASVDFVTAAGRGGKVLEILESARHDTDDYLRAVSKIAEATVPSTTSNTTNVPIDPTGRTTTQESEEDTMPNIEEAEIGRLREAAGRVPVLESERDTAIAERDQAVTERDQARGQLAEARATETARTRARARVVEGNALLAPAVVDRIVESATRTVPLTEAGGLDETAFDAAVDAARTAEETYLAGLAEAAGGGRVIGLGTTTTPADADESALRESNAKDRARMFGRQIKEA